MATDPTRLIQSYEYESVFKLQADDLLDRLAGLPAQYDVPYVTVMLDWSLDGSNPVKKSASVEADQLFRDLIGGYDPRSMMYAALEWARDQLIEFIGSEMSKTANGVYAVAHEPSGVFEATGLALPVETRVIVEPTPAIYTLVRLLEDNPTYAVLQADQADATLSLITQGVRDRSVELTSTLYPRHVQAGGLNQARYQRRAGERVDAFARDTIDQVEHAMHNANADVLIIAASEVMLSALQNAMPGRMQGMVYETIKMEPSAPAHEKIARTMPLAEKVEREREAGSVQRLKNAIGHGTMGVAGAADTLRALQNGQVHLLVMSDTFEADGWADYTMHLFGVGPMPQEHPLGGDVTNLAPISIREEMARLAMATDAAVDIVHSTPPIDDNGVRKASSDLPLTEAAQDMLQMGGVGAVLRFALAGARSSRV